jgi:2'-5' RNA ligase
LTPVFAGRPLIVTATFGDGDNGWLQELRRTHYPPERNRVPVHLTLFRQLPPSLEGELATRLARAAAAPPPRAAIAGITNLGEGTAFRVESDDLEAILGELAEAFRGLLMPQDQAPWRPHVTIQNKVLPRDARALQRQLRATFEPRPLAIKALAAWHYLGGPWQPIRAWPFRL